MKSIKNISCPCCSKVKYKNCCQPYHKGKIAKTPLELMRSRFTAFAIGDIDYIIKTSTFQNDYDDLKTFSQNCQFKKLKILEDTNNSVKFEATIICDGEDNSFIEHSFFIQKDGKWYYDSGEIE